MPKKTVFVDAVQVDGFKIEAASRQHKTIIDQTEADGGSDSGPTPLEYLFISLAGCIITIGLMIARQKRLPVRNIAVHIEGVLDTDILMGKSSAVRSGFMGIRAVTTIDADMTLEEKLALVREIEIRCPISDNLKDSTPIELIVA